MSRRDKRGRDAGSAQPRLRGCRRSAGKDPNRKFSLRFGKEETSTEDKRRRLRRLVPPWSFLTCLRRPYLFPCAGKDRGEKGAGMRLVLPASELRQLPMLQASFHSVVTLRMSWYAPPDTVGIRFVTSFCRISAINRRCRPDLLVCTFLRGVFRCLQAPNAFLYEGKVARRSRDG